MINNQNWPKGSVWRKWDLHAHSSESDGFKGSFDDFKQQIINADCSVIGINDYFSVEGYRKIKQEINENGLNISDKKILPVVEFRMKDVLKNKHDRRSERHFNFHVIFSDKIAVEDIETFIKSLKVDGSQISSNYTNKKYLKEIAKIRFEEDVIKKLSDDKKFKDNFLIWLPYDEYGGIDQIDPKTDDWIKRGFIKKSDVLGSSTKKQISFFLWNSPKKENGSDKYTQEQFKKWFKKKKSCIKGSDSHNKNFPLGCLMDSKSKPIDKYCWIKADPTYEGLKQITYEPESRVFIGKEPEIKSRVRNNQTKYIKSLDIDHVDGYDGKRGLWFNKVHIDFNKELVAIIGNKGSGKSAITDILGLLANSKTFEHFSFLHTKKFKKGKLASNFTSKLTWEDDSDIKKNLNDEIDKNKIETIKYLPQNYFEVLCGDIDNKNFKKELEEVVFTHLEDKDRFSKDDFQSLIAYKTTNAKDGVLELKNKLNNINESVIRLEVKKNTKYKDKLESKLEQKQKELKAHKKNKPKEVKISKSIQSRNKEDFKKIKTLNDKVEAIKEDIKNNQDEQKTITREIEELRQFNDLLSSKKIDLDEFKESNKQKLISHGLDINKIITFKIDKSDLNAKRTEKKTELLGLRNKCLSEDVIDQRKLEKKEKNDLKRGSLVCLRNKKISQIEKLQKKLDTQAKKYQEYLESFNVWKEKEKEIEGNDKTSDTLKYYKKELSFIETGLHEDLKTLRDDRLKITINIFNKKREVVGIYKKIKEAIDNIISSKQALLKDYQIIVEAGFNIKAEFSDNFFSYINQSAVGSFRSVDGGNKKLKEILDGKDLDNKNNIEQILSDIIKYLEVDKREKFGESTRYIDNQIKNPIGFYNYLFSLDFLEENYKLRLGKKDLDELSPGERGALLLVFYLMLDKNDIPLVIDQPEDNLDNQSVTEILVPFIKEAKTKRQIIMVTHSPNLAVVADAEQIIYVSIDKESGKNEFSFQSGAIENPEINKRIVDVLEGTMPAFDQRRLKYFNKTLDD